MMMTDEERRRGVIAASAGNHAQGVATMRPNGTFPSRSGCRGRPLVKLSATRNHGADVVLHGENYDGPARRRWSAVRRHATFIHPFDDDEVIAGQGTLGLGTAAAESDLGRDRRAGRRRRADRGVSCAVKERASQVEVVGANRPSAVNEAQRWGNAPVELPAGPTLADGIAVKSRLPYAPLVQRYVDQRSTASMKTRSRRRS